MDERMFWVAWSRMPKLGGARLLALNEHFGSLSAAWGASPRQLAEVSLLGPKLAAEIAVIVKEPDVQEKLGKTMGMELVGSTPDELRALMATEIPRWAEVVKKSGATVE